MTRDRFWLVAVVVLVSVTLACSTSNAPQATPVAQGASAT
jgi:hypothetical protein